MIWLAVGVAALSILVCVLRADQDFTDYRNRRAGRFSFDTLQYHTGLKSQAELESHTDKPPGADRMYRLSRFEFARLPRNRWISGPDHGLLNVAAGVGLVVFLVLLARGSAEWSLFGVCAGYVALCFLWDTVTFFVFDPDLDLAVDQAREDATQAVSAAINRLCAELDEDTGDDSLDDAPDDALSLATQISLVFYDLRLDIEDLKHTRDVETKHPGNGFSIRLLYRVSYAGVIAWLSRSMRTDLRELKALVAEIDGIPRRSDPRREPVTKKSIESDLLARIRAAIEQQTQRALTSDDASQTRRLDDLRTVEESLVARVG